MIHAIWCQRQRIISPVYLGSDDENGIAAPDDVLQTPQISKRVSLMDCYLGGLGSRMVVVLLVVLVEIGNLGPVHNLW